MNSTEPFPVHPATPHSTPSLAQYLFRSSGLVRGSLLRDPRLSGTTAALAASQILGSGLVGTSRAHQNKPRRNGARGFTQDWENKITSFLFLPQHIMWAEPVFCLASQNECVTAQKFKVGVVTVFGRPSRTGQFRGTAGSGSDEVQKVEQHREAWKKAGRGSPNVQRGYSTP